MTIKICLPIFLFSISVLLFPVVVVAQTITNPQSYTITISASLGEPKLTLYGYTSAGALVRLEGTGVSETTTAGQNGYFLFDHIFLPSPTFQTNSEGLSQLEYPELCLTAIDRENRGSFPTCIPSLPPGDFEIEVGPVLLPPTISISKGDYLPNEQVTAQGETIPDSLVSIFLANTITSRSSSLFARFLPQPAQAYSLPKYQIQANSKGQYEFNLPVEQSQWLVFASSDFKLAPTPKSNSLEFKVLSPFEVWWQKIVSFFKWIFAFFRPDRWLLIIILELLFIALLLALNRHFKKAYRESWLLLAKKRQYHLIQSKSRRSAPR